LDPVVQELLVKETLVQIHLLSLRVVEEVELVLLLLDKMVVLDKHRQSLGHLFIMQAEAVEVEQQ
jgi:hypothetical protein